MNYAEFNTLALELFARQYEGCIAYRAFCNAQDAHPDAISCFKQIPAITTDCFKSPNFSLKTGIWKSQHVFHTSGTTQYTTGKHHFPNLDRYAQSVINGWPEELKVRAFGSDDFPLLFLDEPAVQKPHSSLTAMMQILADHFGAPESCWLRKDDGSLDIAHLERFCNSGQKVFIFGTATAFLELFRGTSMPLPEGSIAMETGGYKATGVDLTKEEFYRLFRNHLGLEPDAIWNEYSMTELSSQFYTHGLGRDHVAPDSARVVIINPATGAEVARGEAGYLVIYDLANEHSIMAIRTQDIAIRAENGSSRSFRLIGRDPAATPRGCSRALSL